MATANKGARKEKEVTGLIKLQIPAGGATPAPPVGPALGQRGLNIADFCKAFNAATDDQEKGLTLPVVVTAYADRSYSFVIKTPPTSSLIKRALSLEKGSATPHTAKVGKLSMAQTKDIAALKMPDLNAHTPAAAARIVAGTARSMGVEVEGPL